MNESSVAFTPTPPDPRLDELDEEIATLIAEMLFHHLLQQGNIPSADSQPGVENAEVDSQQAQT